MLALAGVTTAIEMAGPVDSVKKFIKENGTGLNIGCLEQLRPDIVIHRLTGDGPENLLIAPKWSLQKRRVLNHIHHTMHTQNTWQGKHCQIS